MTAVVLAGVAGLFRPWRTGTHQAKAVLEAIRADGSLGGEFGPIVEDELPAPPPSPIALTGVEAKTAAGDVGPSITVAISGVTATAAAGSVAPVSLPAAPVSAHLTCAVGKEALVPGDAVCRHCVDLLIAAALVRNQDQITAAGLAEVAKLLRGSSAKAN